MSTHHFFLTIRDHILSTSQYHKNYKYAPLLPAPSTIAGAYIKALLRVLDGSITRLDESLFPKAIHVAPLKEVYQLYRFRRIHIKVESGKESGAPEWYLKLLLDPYNKEKKMKAGLQRPEGYKTLISTGTYTVISEMRIHMKFDAKNDVLDIIKKALYSMVAIGESDNLVIDYKVEGPYKAAESKKDDYTNYYTRVENAILDKRSKILLTRYWETVSLNLKKNNPTKINGFGKLYAVPLSFMAPAGGIHHYTGAPLLRVFKPLSVKVKKLEVVKVGNNEELVPKEDNVKVEV